MGSRADREIFGNRRGDYYDNFGMNFMSFFFWGGGSVSILLGMTSWEDPGETRWRAPLSLPEILAFFFRSAETIPILVRLPLFRTLDLPLDVSVIIFVF